MRMVQTIHTLMPSVYKLFCPHPLFTTQREKRALHKNLTVAIVSETPHEGYLFFLSKGVATSFFPNQ